MPGLSRLGQRADRWVQEERPMGQHGGPQPQEPVMTGTRPRLAIIFASFQSNTVAYISNILHHLCKRRGGRSPKMGSFGPLQPIPCGSRVRLALAKGCPGCSREARREQAGSAARNDLETAHSSHAASAFQGRGGAAAPLRSRQVELKGLGAGRSLASQRLQKDAKPCSCFSC